jgi:hypothetical protein
MKKSSKTGKAYTIISENPKMDTSGMAGKSAPLRVYEFKMPTMSLGEMMEVREMKQAKKPEMDS